MAQVCTKNLHFKISKSPHGVRHISIAIVEFGSRHSGIDKRYQQLGASRFPIFRQREIDAIPFLTTIPELWFGLIETRFDAFNITEDVDCYRQVVKNLGIGLFTKMPDVLTSLSHGRKYEKVYLINKYAEHDEKKLEKLFRKITLDDRLLSELYTKMKRCGNTQVYPDKILRIWWRHLPRTAVTIDNEIAQRDAVQTVKKADRLANLKKCSPAAHAGAIASQLLASSNASPSDELNVLYARIAASEKRESRSKSRDSHSRRGERSRL